MPLGLVRSGDFRKGTPTVLPHVFGNPVNLPEPFEGIQPQSNSSLDSNPVTWVPNPAHFGNPVDLSLQTVPPVVIVAPGSTGIANINLTQLLGTPTPTLTYSGAPAGVTLAFVPNPDTGTSMCTITVGSSVPVGKYTITIIGTSGTEIDSTNFHLVVATQSGTTGIFILTATFTNIQILNLKTSPVLNVIPSPGPGFAIELLQAAWEFTPGSVPYTVSGGTSSPVLCYGTTPGPSFTLDAGLTANHVIVSGATTKQWFFSASAPSNPWVASQVINAPICLADEGDFSTISGGTGSTVTLNLIYEIIAAQ